jgi:hypothetical protein
MTELMRQPPAESADHTDDIVRHCFDLMIVLHHENATPDQLHAIHDLAEHDVNDGSAPLLDTEPGSA